MGLHAGNVYRLICAYKSDNFSVILATVELLNFVEIVNTKVTTANTVSIEIIICRYHER